jgi:hypothetical protein
MLLHVLCRPEVTGFSGLTQIKRWTRSKKLPRCPGLRQVLFCGLKQLFLFGVHTSEGEILLTSTLYRTPLIRIKLDGDSFGYAEIPDNWIFNFCVSMHHYIWVY